MIQLAERNRQSKWVHHWRGEIDRLLNLDFVVMLVSEIKGRWDKRRALQETLEDLAAADQRYRTVAANYVSKVFGLKKLQRELPANLAEEFRSMVKEAADRGLEAN
jgi:hypothetical protein